MKPGIIHTLLLILFSLPTIAQTFEVDTIQYHGNPEKLINIVILGDGYTSNQQTQFVSDATNLSSYLLTQAPYSNYQNYFNVFAIKVISAESGALHPNTAPDCSSATTPVPVSDPNTYFKCSFDAYGIHRLVVPGDFNAIMQVLANNFPHYDQVLLLANTPYYGGSGGAFATSTLNSSSNEITAHEIGHSFANLADEYYAGDNYAAEKTNMTQTSATAAVKWKNWVGYNSVGVYQHCCGGNAALWYRPHQNCKMRYLDYPYCNVCMQGIVEKIHTLATPIISYTPDVTSVSATEQNMLFKLTQLLLPIPNTLKISWTLNQNTLAINTDSLLLNPNLLLNGNNTLTVSVTDTTALLRADNHASIHTSTVTWTINKTLTGISSGSRTNNYTINAYPNPTTGDIALSIHLNNSETVQIMVLSEEGKFSSEFLNRKLDSGTHDVNLPMKDFPPGLYIINIKVGRSLYSEKIIKE